MRTAVTSKGGVSARAIAGSHTVLLAMDLDVEARRGLLGFAIRRQFDNQPPRWLKGSKVFRSVISASSPGEHPSDRCPISIRMTS